MLQELQQKLPIPTEVGISSCIQETPTTTTTPRLIPSAHGWLTPITDKDQGCREEER